MANIKDIAKLVGISPASVSIYLNNPETGRVSTKTKENIDLAVKQLKYKKNIFARNLATSRSKIIGILIPTEEPFFKNLYTNSMLSGIQQYLARKGYGIMFLQSNGTGNDTIILDQIKYSIGCDGYILFSTGFCTEQQIRNNIESLSSLNKPFVTMNIKNFKDLKINQVLIHGVSEPTGLDYLIKKGHKNIITLLGREKGTTSITLKENAIKIYKRNNLPYNEELVGCADYNSELAYNVIKEKLEKMKNISAICCMSDTMAVGAMNAALDLGYRIPEDISIIGRNNSSAAKLARVKLTTVDLEMFEAGKNAAKILLEHLKGDKLIRQIIINDSIVEGLSVKDLN